MELIFSAKYPLGWFLKIHQGRIFNPEKRSENALTIVNFKDTTIFSLSSKNEDGAISHRVHF